MYGRVGTKNCHNVVIMLQFFPMIWKRFNDQNVKLICNMYDVVACHRMIILTKGLRMISFNRNLLMTIFTSMYIYVQRTIFHQS